MVLEPAVKESLRAAFFFGAAFFFATGLCTGFFFFGAAFFFAILVVLKLENMLPDLEVKLIRVFDFSKYEITRMIPCFNPSANDFR